MIHHDDEFNSDFSLLLSLSAIHLRTRTTFIESSRGTFYARINQRDPLEHAKKAFPS